MPFKPLRTLRKLENRFSPISYHYTDSNDFRFLKRKINLYFFFFPQKKKKYVQELNFINQNTTDNKSIKLVWPYPFVKKYAPEKIEVFTDSSNGLFYVMQNGKKLYYSRHYKTVEAVQASYISLVVEQDPNSPHYYQNESFKVQDGDFVVDIGAAEGNFSLDIVEKAGKIIIIEAELHWIEALNATFEPWKEKVEIIHKYISNTDNDRCATLKNIVGENNIDFLKLDVEGAEMSIMSSSVELFRSKQVRKLAICTYHKGNDEKVFESMLINFGYNINKTQGYMLFVYGKLTPPFFRKVLIQAVACP